MLEQFLWGIFPYIVFTVFIGGHFVRYQYDQLGWTAKSSEFLEKKELRIGSLLFHWGILIVMAGHVMGILIPASFYESIGISEAIYHKMAILFGIPAGIISCIGLFILWKRRLFVKRIRVTSSKTDMLVLFLLTVVIMSGLSSTILNIDSNGFDYRLTIGPWFRSIFLLQADPSYMADVPIWFKIHIFCALFIFIVWPFTRLVHVFSIPFQYLLRSYVIYRKRSSKQHLAK